MKKRSVLIYGSLGTFALILIGGFFAFSLYNKPHRDVQAASPDMELEASQLVAEYVADAGKADEIYLPKGEKGKILVLSGTVSSLGTDANNQMVILLKDAKGKAGVSCTFSKSAGSIAEKLKVGDRVRIKGVLKAGAGYDEDLELYEDAILEECDLYTGKD